MKTLIMTVTFQIGVDVLGFIQTFKHDVHCVVDTMKHGKHSTYTKQNGTQIEERLLCFKVEQGIVQ